MNRDEFDIIYNSIIGTLLNDDFEDFLSLQTQNCQFTSDYIMDDEDFRDLMAVLMGMSV